MSTAESCRVDLSEIEREINRNTISIAASAPCWPYDVVDPTADIAQVAMSRMLWFHANACVGVFSVNFWEILDAPIPNSVSLSLALIQFQQIYISIDIHQNHVRRSCGGPRTRRKITIAHVPTGQWDRM